ncbi:MAG: DUF4129 domain-containing protein [Deltaproteobacteria bacterium]|nr:DUF4129 domain-containing protein [Deltaproteobacteria bacterium]
MTTEMEKGRVGPFVHVFGAGMDLCWLQAWTAFVLHAFFAYEVPLLFVISIYCCGSLTEHYCYFRKRLRIQVLLVKTILFSAAFLGATRFFLFRHNHNTFPSQFSRMFGGRDPFMDWSLMLIILLMAGIVWRRSTIHVSKPLSPENIYLRVDLGIAAFFSLLILKLMLFGRFHVTLLYPDLKYLFFPFFMFALLTIGLMLSGGNGNRQYAAGFGRMGIILSFGAVMVSGGSGMIFLFHSQMTTSAEILSRILKKAGPPLEGAIIWLGRLLWSSRHNDVLPPPSASKDPGSYAGLAKGAVEPGWLTSVLKWGTTAVLALTILFLIYLLLRFLLHFLLTQTDSKKVRNTRIFVFPEWVKRFITFIARTLNRIPALLKGIDSAAGLFTALASWGRRSGMPYKKTDTPMEYGARLAASFPGLKTEIEMIVHLVYQEIYGGLKLESHQIDAGKSAKRRMAHPVFWKKRIKTWVFSGGK